MPHTYVHISIRQSSLYSHGLEAEISVSYHFLCPARMLQEQGSSSDQYRPASSSLHAGCDSRHEYTVTPKASRWPQIQSQSIYFSKFPPDPPSRECATKEPPPPPPPPLKILDTPLHAHTHMHTHSCTYAPMHTHTHTHRKEA